MGKKKNFIQKRPSNPVLVQKRLDKLEKEVLLHGKNIDAVSKSHDNHITMLSNFARHDIKNSVQSMDSILSTNSIEELSEQHIESLKLNLKIIRETIDNFSKLIPYSENDTFELDQLIIALELLNRKIFYDNKIDFIKEIPNISFSFSLPFQSVVQMLNNIILNAVKAFDHHNYKVKKIKLVVELKENAFFLKIYDNADKVTLQQPDSMFDYGVSTTGGSGIGLFHAKYLCNLYKGDIKYQSLEYDEEFTKYFSIDLPITK